MVVVARWLDDGVAPSGARVRALGVRGVHGFVPNRQARGDGMLVSIDGTSLYHEARVAGVIYQATLRRELYRSMGSSGPRWTPRPGWPSWLGWTGLHHSKNVNVADLKFRQFGPPLAANLSGCCRRRGRGAVADH